jgi:hypothetical protein
MVFYGQTYEIVEQEISVSQQWLRAQHDARRKNKGLYLDWRRG